MGIVVVSFGRGFQQGRKKDIDHDLRKNDQMLCSVRRQIKKLTARIVVSEHALLRFTERIMGLESKEIERKILSTDFQSLVRQFGGSGQEVMGVVDNNIVTTIYVKGIKE